MGRNLTILGLTTTVSSKCAGTHRNVSPFQARQLPGPSQHRSDAGLSVCLIFTKWDISTACQLLYVGTESPLAERVGVAGAIQGALWLLNRSK